jgi:hypothetical protein
VRERPLTGGLAPRRRTWHVWYLLMVIVASILLVGVWTRWIRLELLSTAWLGVVALFMVGIPWLRCCFSAASPIAVCRLAWLLIARSDRGWRHMPSVLQSRWGNEPCSALVAPIAETDVYW